MHFTEAGVDFETPIPSVTFPCLPISVTQTSSVNVMTIDDMALEGDHSFSVEIASVDTNQVSVGTPNSVSVMIIDNDGNRD